MPACMLTLHSIPQCRILHLARDYSVVRRAFGKFLADHPLHMQTLGRMEVRSIYICPSLHAVRVLDLFLSL